MTGSFYCDGKQAFETYALAEHVVKRMRGRNRHSASRLSVYRCNECNQFHIGNRRKGIRRQNHHAETWGQT